MSTSGDVSLRHDLTLDAFGNARFLWAQNSETGGPVTQYMRRYGANGQPTADAGPDAVVAAGNVVTLNGSGSDLDHDLATYRWTQTAGPAVVLNDADTAVASFVAPTFPVDTPLTFELRVINTLGGSAIDAVTITVQGVGGPDTTPPVTTVTDVRTTAKGIAYHDLTMATDEPATVHFRLSGAGTVLAGAANTSDWQIYDPLIAPIRVQIDKRGQMTLEYYAVDPAGNIEATRTEVLQ